MKLSLLVAALVGAGAYALLVHPAKAEPAPSPFPVPPGPLPIPVPPVVPSAYRAGDTVLVPFTALFPGGLPPGLDVALLAAGGVPDAARVLVDQVLGGGMLQGRMTAVHAADAWQPLTPPVPTPPFPQSVVTSKLLNVT